MKGNPYVGKIGHTGTQTVKVNSGSTNKGNGTVKTGTDLRTGGSKGSGKGC